MATTDHASIIRAVYDSFNAKDLERMASYAADGAQSTNVPAGTTASFRDDAQGWARAFPDGSIELKTLVEQGEHVFVEMVFRGTHAGPLLGPAGEIPATGRRVEVPAAELYRFRGDEIIELRYYFDAFSFFQQLGLGAPQPRAGASGTTAAHQQN